MSKTDSLDMVKNVLAAEGYHLTPDGHEALRSWKADQLADLAHTAAFCKTAQEIVMFLSKFGITVDIR